MNASGRMKNFVKNIKRNLETEIKRIEQQPLNRLDKIKQIVDCTQTSLALLKTTIAGYRFENPDEEILFFKVWKPQISSLLIYYVRLYQIEKKRIGQSSSAQYRCLKTEYENLEKDFPDYDFYSYYQSGETELDYLYFTREHYDILSDVHCQAADKDLFFSTLHDSSVARVQANNRLARYLINEINLLSEELHIRFASIIESQLLQWTDSKVALVEFIYALYAGKCFNRGDTNLKDIAFCCETLFNIEIGDFYRIFLEIRSRKKNRTLFLDKLKEKITKMMDELDR